MHIQFYKSKYKYNFTNPNTNTILQIEIQIKFFKYEDRLAKQIAAHNAYTILQIQIQTQFYKYKYKYNFTNTKTDWRNKLPLITGRGKYNFMARLHLH